MTIKYSRAKLFQFIESNLLKNHLIKQYFELDN